MNEKDLIVAENEVCSKAIEKLSKFSNVSVSTTGHMVRKYGLHLIIDDSMKNIVIIDPFTYAMSRKTLAYVYARITTGNSGNESRTLMLIKTINKIIRSNYYGTDISYNIETGKYNFEMNPKRIISIMKNIFEDAFMFSAEREPESIGEIYSMLGGEKNSEIFFEEFFRCVSASIPEVGEMGEIKNMRHIKCRTCKYCSTKDGVQYCTKAAREIKADRAASNPSKFSDIHYDPKKGVLVSAIIDDRMDRCDDYRCR